MKGDCEAETFEEAFRKNEHRLAYERDEAASLREAMLKDGEDPRGIDPEFWEGSLEANKKAWEIWKARGELTEDQVVNALRLVPMPEGKPKAFVSGFKGVLDHWTDAVEEDRPGAIVWW